MFLAAELGRKVKKKKFDALEPDLHTQLLTAQREARAKRVPLVVLVSGVEGAGKGEVVNRLHRWFDTRWVRTHAFWDENDMERERPRFWRFWQKLPPAGTTAVLFGSWYTRPIVDRAFRRVGQARFEQELRRIAEFERLLSDDGALIVKFWFHLSKEEQQKRLRDDVKQGRITSPLLKKYARRYDDFLAVSERAIRLTDVGACPWHIVDAHDRRYRDLTVGRTLLSALRARLAAEPAAAPSAEAEASGDAAATADVAPARTNDASAVETPASTLAEGAAARTVLDTVDLEAVLAPERYRKELRRHQRRLNELAWRAHTAGRHTIALFEGWDAAGKGGAIRRITQAVDARLYQVISVAAPTEEERAQHYLWRFWRHLPRAGAMTFYDRSWYGRVLVERVERFAHETDWRRAYHEINDFEEQLVDHGVVLLKFWLHISPEEQLRRFEERERTAWKKHKITQEDWRNREKWDAYRAAVDEMVARTHTNFAPWSLIGANDARHARVEVLRTVCDRLDAALS